MPPLIVAGMFVIPPCHVMVKELVIPQQIVQTQHSTFYCLYLNQNSFPAKIELGGMEEEEEEDCYITFTTSESRCDALFDRGIDMVAQGDPSAALSVFLETLTALQDCQYTNKLIPTLYQVAEAYKVLGETEKSREILDTVSIMQEALDAAMREKWKERKRHGRAGSMFHHHQQQQQSTDCGALFIKKAEECLGLVGELGAKADVEHAVESAESGFRILQFTLGPQHPRTLQTLRDLTTLYTGQEHCISVQLTHCVEPIIFTATIKSLCSQFSEQNKNPASDSVSVTLSGITLTPATCPSPLSSSLLHCNSIEDPLSTSSHSVEETNLLLVQENCLHKKEEEEEELKTSPLPVKARAHTQSTPTSQDVYTPWVLGDKTWTEFQCTHPESDPPASNCSRNSGGFSRGFSSYFFSHSLITLSTHLASIFTLFVAFGLMAVAALSIY